MSKLLEENSVNLFGDMALSKLGHFKIVGKISRNLFALVTRNLVSL